MNFIILGYGVPKDILKDQNYNFYLRTAFNRILTICREKKERRPLIIFSGGKTNLIRPYAKSEGGEMLKLFRTLCRRPFVRKETADWCLSAEEAAISTLENLVNSKKIIKNKKGATTYIFCEFTRERRVRVLAKQIFGPKVSVASVDFDNSPNRYLTDEFIRNKEEREIKFALWALKNKDNFEKHHQIYLEKFEYFREVKQSGKDVNFIKEWWEARQKQLINNLKIKV